MREFKVFVYAVSLSAKGRPFELLCGVEVMARNRAHACHVAWWESPLAAGRAGVLAEINAPAMIADRDQWCRFNGIIPLCSSLDDGPSVAEFQVSGHPGFDFELVNPVGRDVRFQVAELNHWGNPKAC